MTNGIIKNFAGNRNEWFRLMLFVGFYVLLDYCYFKIPIDLFVNVIYYHGVVVICADVINMIAPHEQVLPQLNHLLSVNTDLEIVRGCDGAGMLFLVASAILVFPSKLSQKLKGLVLGIGLIYMVNLWRIILLYFVIAHHSDWFQLIHIYLAPTFMVIVGCTYFAWWGFNSLDNSNESA